MTPRPPRFDTDALERTMASLAARLDRHRSELNRLNVYPVPDGDTGDNLSATLDSVLAHIGTAGPDGDVVDAVATGAVLGGRGSSGVILGQGLRGFVTNLPGDAGAADLAAALSAAAAAARDAIADPVEGTILTVADDAARQARSAASAGESLAGVARAAADEGWRSLARTPDLLPALARAGVVDAGGFGYVLFLDALAEAITGEERPHREPEAPVLQVTTVDDGSPAKQAGGRYEILCVLAADQDQLRVLRERWSDLGDTVAIAGTGDTWRGHVHTDDVVGALAAARQAGGVSGVEITDLLAPQDGRPAAERGLHPVAPDGSAVSIVAVAEGDALVAAYLEAGARRVVLGGITEKPSTGELLRVLDACASEVVVLPGDKDVLPAARRAAELAAVPARVVPADMLAGLLALEAVGPGLDGDADSGAAQLERASHRIRTARVQRAVRESETELGTVRVGEWLARGTAGLVAIGATAREALDAAAAALVGPGTTRALVAVDQEAPAPEDVVAGLRRAHPHVQWLRRRTNRPSCAYGIAVW
ncbi:DAK2 domain-containing protein [Mycobacterium sp. Y57]|uniref:DAK2 domain-containing protein n=1 Tax=Mycolicibacterium xanthum TaxID=2796469 RepID=UPI001C85600C|nr:DAK2 domain-containing protein [Mycolicibacterium xanthum]MBX7431862.1 DAK2 domain-containing protein [Mycolicibacterium xanthum]